VEAAKFDGDVGAGHAGGEGPVKEAGGQVPDAQDRGVGHDGTRWWQREGGRHFRRRPAWAFREAGAPACVRYDRSSTWNARFMTRHSPMHDKMFLCLLAVVSVAFAAVLWPFSGAVFWGAILAIIFNPVHR